MGTIYRNKIAYGGGGSSTAQFIGTKAEWLALPDEDKDRYINHEVIFKDEENKSVNIYTVNGDLINVSASLGDLDVEGTEISSRREDNNSLSLYAAGEEGATYSISGRSGIHTFRGGKFNIDTIERPTWDNEELATLKDLSTTHVGTIDDGTPGCIWVE